MKIHDKFVIELREVIKGYGNDPTVQDPCKFPCDYKFYEIEGVAICEKSFEKMKRLEDEVNAVLDKIRAEIVKKHLSIVEKNDFDSGRTYAYEEVIDIIDKYKAESEAADGNSDMDHSNL